MAVVKRITMVIPQDLHKELKTYCAVNEYSMREIMLQALKDFLEERKD